MSKKILQLIILFLIFNCSGNKSNLEVYNSIYTVAKGVEYLPIISKKDSTINITISFSGGSYLQNSEQEGLMHLLEHMLINKIKDELTLLKIKYYGETYYDYMNIVIKTDIHNYRQVFDIISSLFYITTFKTVDLNYELLRINREISKKRKNVNFKIWDTIKKSLYSSDFHKVEALGQTYILNEYSINDLNIMYKRILTNSRKLILIEGNFSKSWVRKKLAIIFKNNIIESYQEESNSNTSENISFTKKEQTMNIFGCDSNEIWISWKGPGVINNFKESIIADVYIEYIEQVLAQTLSKHDPNNYIKSIETKYLSIGFEGPLYIRICLDKISNISDLKKIKTETLILLNKRISSFTQIDLNVIKNNITKEWILAHKSKKNIVTLIPKIWSVSHDLKYGKSYISIINKTCFKELLSFKDLFLNKPTILYVLGGKH